ncbi:MAG: hypothetical protein EA422_01420 [Gemmatimonadales bacterium]|nr:MAG: hypothetical protein EA422_01420 [Gemmatimonadales bacterium]
MIHLVPLLIYGVALLLWIRLLLKGSDVQDPAVPAGITGLGVVVHAIALGSFWTRFGELPLVGPGAALSSLAFVGGLAMVATLPLKDVGRVAIALLPLVMVMQGVALILGVRPSETALDFQGAGFVLHVSFAFLGYQGLALAFAAGLLYLVQHHELKEKRLGRFFHFIPPLATLDRLGRVGVWGGFGALTVALLLGWAWTVEHRGSLEISDPKVLWAVTSWFVFLGILVARGGGGRNDYRGAVASVVGFGVVIGTYLILRVTIGGTGLFL